MHKRKRDNTQKKTILSFYCNRVIFQFQRQHWLTKSNNSSTQNSKWKKPNHKLGFNWFLFVFRGRQETFESFYAGRKKSTAVIITENRVLQYTDGKCRLEPLSIIKIVIRRRYFDNDTPESEMPRNYDRNKKKLFR